MRPHPRRARTNPRSPRAWGTSDRNGMVGNHENLQWQFDWAGIKLVNKYILVHPDELDKPQRQLGTIILPPDPVSLLQARPDTIEIDLEQTFLLDESGAQLFGQDGHALIAENCQATGIILPSAPFDPTSLITGAGGFWRADEVVTQSGGTVSAWGDTGPFRSAPLQTLAVANAAPTWNATAFNGNPGVLFADNSHQAMETGAASIASSTYSFFLLLIETGVAAGSTRMGAIYNGVASSDYITPNIVPYNSGSGSSPGFGVFSNVEMGNGGSGAAITQGVPVLVGFVADGASANKWVNGSVVGASTAFSSILGTASSSFAIGAPDPSFNCTGMTVAFFGFTQKVMTAGDWTNLKMWTNANWGTSF